MREILKMSLRLRKSGFGEKFYYFFIYFSFIAAATWQYRFYNARNIYIVSQVEALYFKFLFVLINYFGQ